MDEKVSEAGKQSTNDGSGKQNKAMWDSLTHQFFSLHDKWWKVLVTRLESMEKSYKGKRSISICRCCWSLVSHNTREDHEDIALRSIWSELDPTAPRRESIMSLLVMHGKTIVNYKREKLLCFPGFDLFCSKNYCWRDREDEVPRVLETEKLNTIVVPRKREDMEDSLGKRKANNSVSKTPTKQLQVPKKQQSTSMKQKRRFIVQYFPKILGKASQHDKTPKKDQSLCPKTSTAKKNICMNTGTQPS